MVGAKPVLTRSTGVWYGLPMTKTEKLDRTKLDLTEMYADYIAEGGRRPISAANLRRLHRNFRETLTGHFSFDFWVVDPDRVIRLYTVRRRGIHLVGVTTILGNERVAAVTDEDLVR